MNGTPKKKKKWKKVVKRIILWLLILLILAGAAFYGYNELKSEYTVTYDSYTAKIGSISNSLSFSGNLQLVDSASYQATSSTTVRQIYVAVGDDVKEGDKLMRLADGTVFEADFDGRVNVLNVEKDDSVSPNSTLIQIADFSHMKVTVRVDEYDIADVQIGSACTVTATATEKTFSSQIESIDYISNSNGNVAYYSAVCYVDVDDGIYPGMQVTVTIPQEEATDVVVLKMDALSFDAMNSAYVWVYNDAGELEQKYVEVGVSNGNYVEIKDGLSDGDEVFVEVEVETASGLSSLLSGVFGGTQMNMPSGGMGGGDFSDFDPSSMGGGSMADFSSGNMPSMPSSGGGGNGGGSGGMGGGNAP